MAEYDYFRTMLGFPAVCSIRMNRTKSKKCSALYTYYIIIDRITPCAHCALGAPCICIHHMNANFKTKKKLFPWMATCLPTIFYRNLRVSAKQQWVIMMLDDIISREIFNSSAVRNGSLGTDIITFGWREPIV
jgi:hypothetical protein